ncbi:MAG TPA: bifunctional diguanylate cyclase/phosphodiesterase [Acidimicrobiales bacterium]|nr:bifunctional diguanylate cyclase/phosphodiesterase [Acidimicrobiales bacterium]
MLLAVASIRFRVADWVIGAAGQVEALDVNGILAMAVLVPAATTIYAVRRYRDAMEIREELARLSLRDNLTGLPNRLFLSEWLDRELRLARRRGDRVAVLFVDLDRFKVINDTHGHDVGDAVLAQVASRLRQCVSDRDSDRVVRYAGDEFLVISREDPGRLSADRLARSILTTLEEPFQVGPDTLRVAASIGVALSDGRELMAGEDLIRQADAAMYDAKARDDGRPVLYDVAVHGRRFSPTTLEPHLRRAAEQGEFRLLYQPVVDTATGHLVSVEALLRWDHPDRGPVSPVEFIPVLEESGLIVPVGAWIIEEAFGQALRWHQDHPGRPPLRVAVNVSARQLAQTGFEEHVRATLSSIPVPPGSLCLEITEGALMVDIEAAWSSLRLLKRMGVKLALDDFGTGYSSLSYIRSFSLDMLKIDRSFVKGLGQSAEDTAIVEHVIGMARALGMTTVGEGVETPQQLGELHRLGCDLSQGFLLSRPVEAAEIDAMLAAGLPLGRPGPSPSDGLPPRVAPALGGATHQTVGVQPAGVAPAGVASGAPPWRAER